MNLQSIASSSIASVNANRIVNISISNGYSVNPDGTQIPNYLPSYIQKAQVQELSSSDLQHINGLNLSGIIRKVYINGQLNTVIRSRGLGGDKLYFDGFTWLVVHILESYDAWSCVVIKQQLDT
jgi:hypothetical protein